MRSSSLKAAQPSIRKLGHVIVMPRLADGTYTPQWPRLSGHLNLGSVIRAAKLAIIKFSKTTAALCAFYSTYLTRYYVLS